MTCYSLLTWAINCKAFLSCGTALHRALYHQSPTEKNNPVAGVWQNGAITDVLMDHASCELASARESCPGQRAHRDAGSEQCSMPMPQSHPLALCHHTDRTPTTMPCRGGREGRSPKLSPSIDKTLFCYELDFTAFSPPKTSQLL